MIAMTRCAAGFAAGVMSLLAAFATLYAAQDQKALSLYSSTSPAPTADPQNGFWTSAPVVRINSDQYGKPMPGLDTEVRSRWSPEYLYLLFTCRYDALYLKPDPVLDRETNRLWNWDVAEIFIGDDFENIRRYKEFEISPRGEWVDLDINAPGKNKEDAWLWNSGFTVKAHIDDARKIWYGEMRIPFSSISRHPAADGLEFRANFYRAQGPPKARLMSWLPTNAPTFHVPQAFGILRLTK